MPGTTRPRGRPARHSTAEITTAACRLADREGIEAVTMRRVAAELGVGAATLYTYVATRDDLLELMQDAVAAEYVLDAVSGDWRADLVAVAMQTRDIMVRHPWLPGLAESRPGTGPHGLDVLEHVLTVLATHPADDTSKLEAYGAVNAVVLAYVRSESSGDRVGERTVDALARAAGDGRHPHLAALRPVRPDPGPDRLRRTLAGMLTGLPAGDG